MRNEISMPQSSPFLESVRIVIRRKHYSIKTEHNYLEWIRNFIIHFQYRHHSQARGDES